MVRWSPLIFVCALVMAADAGCSKTEQPTAGGSPVAAPSASAEASPSEEASAAQVPEGATPVGQNDVLGLSQGTILRSWPGASSWGQSSDSLMNFWQSKPDSSGPYVFVYELRAPGTIQKLIFSPTHDQDTATHTARVAASTSSATTGFSDVGTFTLMASNEAQEIPMASPVSVRWLKVSIEQRGADTSFTGLQAIGTVDQRPTAGSLSGAWVFARNPLLTHDPASSFTDSFPTPVDPKRLTVDYEFADLYQRGEDVFGIECSTTAITGLLIGKISGSSISFTNKGVGFPIGVVNTERSVIVGALEGQNPYVLARSNRGLGCTALMRPSGNGKQVLFLFDDDPGSYAPYQHEYLFPGYRFAPMPLPLFDVKTLAGFDTVVMSSVCNANTELTTTQKELLTDWVYSGNKLIIDDSDLCTSSDYGFLPYSFRTSNPGRRGAHGDHLVMVESNTLGSDQSDPAHFVDTAGYVGAVHNQLGDVNIVTTKDSHWCGHFFGTNVLGENGYAQMYALYGQGLIIYDGFDRDDLYLAQYQRIVQLELSLPANAQLPCSQSVAGDFSIAPSVEYAFTPGKAETAKFQLQVLASHGYAGTVKLSSEHAGGFTWNAALSTEQVSVNGDLAPFEFTVNIPQDAKPGRYVFTVAGADDRGKNARAFIILSSSRTALNATRVMQTPKPPQIAKTLTKSNRVAVYGIYFDFASDKIRPESTPVLKEIAEALHGNPSWKLTIEGHTDNVGGPDYNLDLSKRRAQAVKAALVGRYHVQSSRLFTIGFGYTRPKASNQSAEGRALNRRVELVRR